MHKLFVIIFKSVKGTSAWIDQSLSKFFCKILFYGNNVQYKDFITSGLPYVSVARGGEFIIGAGFHMNNTLRSNPIGRSQQCVFFVDRNASLIIGDDTGISQAALVCHLSIKIGNNVKIGGGVCIYDTDFHALDPAIRKDASLDFRYKKKSPVVIKDNAFIGAHSTILKGVTIGTNAIVGCSSVVTKDVPDNEIWAGNPARFVKSLSFESNNYHELPVSYNLDS